MKQAITAVLGEYTPTIGASGEVLQGAANLDWQWIAGAIVFVVAIYCLFRVIGALIGGVGK